MSNNFSENTIIKNLLNEYGSLEPLTNDETLTLLEKVSNDTTDKDAKDILVKHNLKYVYNKIKGYRKITNLDDLFFAAMEGFIEALEGATKQKIMAICDNKGMDANHALFYFVSGFMKNSINKALSDEEPMSVTEYEFKHIKKARAAMAEVEAIYGQSLCESDKIDEVVLRTGLTLKQVKQALSSSQAHMSIYTPTSSNDEGDETLLCDSIRDTNSNIIFENVWMDEMSKNIDKACTLLSNVQREVLFDLEGYENHPMLNVTQIANKFNKSRQWVYNTLNASYEILRNAKEDLEAYYIA